MIDKRYAIYTFVGDYPVEHQPNWDIEFDDFDIALTAAKAQHEALRPSWPDDKLHTIISDDPSHEAVLWLVYDGQEYWGEQARLKADQLEDEDWLDKTPTE